MIWERVSLSGAWRDTDSVSCKFSSASASIWGTMPQVDRLICRMPMFSPLGLLTSAKNFSTLSLLSSGSPIPISTMLEMARPLSNWVNST